MAANRWLAAAGGALASAAGRELALSPADAGRLLELARVAAHESGERVSAPLACYLVGRAVATSGLALSELTELALAAGRASVEEVGADRPG